MRLLVALSALVAVSTGQFIFHQPIPIAYQTASQVKYPENFPVAHRAVIENALREAQLPPEYMNRFYKDPKIAAALAKESWFTSKEMPVLEREAEKIPRDQVFKIFKSAGWIKRRR